MFETKIKKKAFIYILGRTPRSFGFLSFEIVSSFEIRISNFIAADRRSAK